MVWPNRGIAGAIGGYGLNVLKLLQTGHRCDHHTKALSAGRDNGPDMRHRPHCLARPRRARLLMLSAAQPRARGTPRVLKRPTGLVCLAATRHAEAECACPRLVNAVAGTAASPPDPRASRARCL